MTSFLSLGRSRQDILLTDVAFISMREGTAASKKRIAAACDRLRMMEEGDEEVFLMCILRSVMCFCELDVEFVQTVRKMRRDIWASDMI